MLNFEFRHIDRDTAAQLIELSRLWVEEDCCAGMVVNERDDLQEPLAVALEGERIVGYLFGHYYDQPRDSSYAPAGTKCFSVDELYVLPQYRGQGIGKGLFRMMEEAVTNHCDCMTLTTSTRNYQAILKLYIEELGMCFNSAFLVKQLTGSEREK
jgi:ribosomal protein S18 acetylase RimI-like enzyme